MSFLKSLFGTKSTKSISDSQLVKNINIPDPTRTLLWLTDEDPAKIASPMCYTISVDFDKRSINSADTSYSFFSEPSLIWTKMPIEKNNELETQKMYYPVYNK